MSGSAPLSPAALRRLKWPAPHAYTPPNSVPFYDPELYPHGVINLSIAENSLLSERLIEHISRPLVSFRGQHLRYRATLIKTDLQTVEDLLPAYINDHFEPRIPVTRENSVAGPGIGALLAQLVWALAGQGEGVLMSVVSPFNPSIHVAHPEITRPSPFTVRTRLSNALPSIQHVSTDDYFRDISHPAQAQLIRAEIPAHVDSLSEDVLPLLEAKIKSSGRLGIPIKAMLIPNPHNPLPQVVPKEVITGYALLAEKYDIHLIVDEVYGMSTFHDSAYPPAVNVAFESALTYDFYAIGVNPARVHVLAGPTKDFGASGLKMGLLVSPHNIPLMDLIRPLFNATPISSASDALFSRVLKDRVFVERFLEDNRIALREAYELVAGWLIWHGLHFTRANAGVYVVVNFEPFLNRISDPDMFPMEKLDRGVAALIKQGVFMKPTNLMGDPVPTRFRLVFSQPRSWMLLALRRIEQAFSAPEAPLPANKFSGLNGTYMNGAGAGNGRHVYDSEPSSASESE
ncbi:unnamed protein product [Mycena citricolor]|uniref:Aminotransferase class I/classII large domain-containing protein n=1 Tax=Mycena citricolor TaxID=2018698 RepID=A0AAD2JZ63_9AGAR|nr:unnamed protein product [Mycena citricolor]